MTATLAAPAVPLPDVSRLTLLASLDDLPAADAWLAAHTGRVALDTETTGLDVWAPDFEVGVVAVSHASGHSMVINGRDRTLVRKVIAKTFAGRHVWAHNANYDAWALRRAYGLKLDSLRDTASAARVAWPQLMNYSLKALRPTTQYAQDALKAHYERVTGKRALGKDWLPAAVRELPWNDPFLVAYVVEDTVETAHLAGDLAAEKHVVKAMLADVEIDQMWRWTGYHGIRVDRKTLDVMLNELVAVLEDAEQRFGFRAHTNTNARQQWVTDRGIMLPRTNKGAWSLNKKARKKAQVPDRFANEWADLCTVINTGTAMSKLKELSRMSERDGRVHPQINAIGAKTGRMSVARPALQNLAGEDEEAGRRSLRELLLADEGKVLVGCDLSHVEPSVMSVAANDDALKRACSPGADPYVEAAVVIWGEAARELELGATGAPVLGADGQPQLTKQAKAWRKKAKMLLLALMYGMGEESLAESISVTKPEARRLKKKILAAYRDVDRWINRTRTATKLRETPHTLTGRPLPCRPSESYTATNYIIQGTAGDIFKRMCAAVRDRLPEGARLWLPVHDELVVECRPKDAETVETILRECMRIEMDGLLINGDPEIIGPRWRK